MVQRRDALISLAASALAGFSQSSHANEEFDELRANFSRGHLFKRIIANKGGSELPPAIDGLAPLPGGFRFPTNAIADGGTPRHNSYFGIDISHYTEPDLDFTVLKEQGVSFVYVKASQGLNIKDGRFSEFYARLNALKPSRRVAKGPYHFLSSRGDGTSQANRFCDVVESNGGFSARDLPPVMDLEWDVATVDGPDRWVNLAPDEIVSRAVAFMARVRERAQKTPMIYTSVSWWKERRIPLALFANFHPYPLWIADYSPSNRALEEPSSFPNGSASLWQFSANAKLSEGYAGVLDASIFRGSREEFTSLFGLAPL